MDNIEIVIMRILALITLVAAIAFIQKFPIPVRDILANAKRFDDWCRHGGHLGIIVMLTYCALIVGATVLPWW